MELRRRAGRQTPGAFIEEATAALRAITAQDTPLLLGYYPQFRTNPYQQLLYQRAREHGVAAVGIRRLDVLPAIESLQRARQRTVLHLHWLHLILRDVASKAEGVRQVEVFLSWLDRYRAAGGRVAWTVHNVLPHETRWEDLEARLCAGVAARADVIHVLTAATAELVSPYYTLPPDRILHVPHPSYAGAYEDSVSRLDARHELGVLPDDFVFLALGAIRPYKGLDRLLTAWRSLPPDPTRRLLVAGDPVASADVEALIEELALAPGVVVDARKIPAEEMQLYLRASDVAVLPYVRALNSGALMLFLTFGLPVIVPSGGGLAEVVEQAFATTFDLDSPGSLARALEDSRVAATPEAGAAALAFARALAPAELSSRFIEELRTRLLPAERAVPGEAASLPGP